MSGSVSSFSETAWNSPEGASGGGVSSVWTLPSYQRSVAGTASQARRNVPDVALNADPRTVAVLPAGTMRRFSWSGPAPVLDPLPRWVRADVLTTGDLAISGVIVPGESDHARAVQDLLLAGPDPAMLAPAGVGWLVVESDSAGDMGAADRTLDALTPVYRDNEFALYRIGGDTAGVPAARRTTTLIAHLAWLAMLLVGAAGAAVCAWRRRARPRR